MADEPQVDETATGAVEEGSTPESVASDTGEEGTRTNEVPATE